jgi:hypothetical protein
MDAKLGRESTHQKRVVLFFVHETDAVAPNLRQCSHALKLGPSFSQIYTSAAALFAMSSKFDSYDRNGPKVGLNFSSNRRPCMKQHGPNNDSQIQSTTLKRRGN